MTRILSIIGTRPEAIKMAPVVQELSKNEKFDSLVCTTAQHREMLDQVFELFSIEPDVDLDLMKEDQQLAELTARMTSEIHSVISQLEPDVVLVQGDTTTVFTGALIGFYHQLIIGHVESGLRTEDKYNPFPEEMNRRLVDHLADYNFAPTDRARQALLDEGIADKKIYLTGNTIVDALYIILDKEVNEETEAFFENYFSSNSRDIEYENEKSLLVTAHRRESFGEDFISLCKGILEAVKKNKNLHALYPVHLNPNVQDPVNRILGDHPRIDLVDPLPYQTFVHVLDESDFVLTDSGGVQEEAPSLGKPVLILRDKTERPEVVEEGFGKVIGTSTEEIIKAIDQTLTNLENEEYDYNKKSIYGDGRASQRICKILEGVT